MTCASIEFAVIRNGQGLFFAGLTYPSQFDMTARLLKNDKTEALKNRNDLSLGICRLDFHRNNQCRPVS